MDFFEACAKNDMHVVSDMIAEQSKRFASLAEAGAKESSIVYAKDKSGQTGLNIAVNHSHYDLIKLLIESGSDITDKMGTTAKRNNRYDIYALLDSVKLDRTDYALSITKNYVSDITHIDGIRMSPDKRMGVIICASHGCGSHDYRIFYNPNNNKVISVQTEQAYPEDGRWINSTTFIVEWHGLYNSHSNDFIEWYKMNRQEVHKGYEKVIERDITYELIDRRIVETYNEHAWYATYQERKRKREKEEQEQAFKNTVLGSTLLEALGDEYYYSRLSITEMPNIMCDEIYKYTYSISTIIKIDPEYATWYPTADWVKGIYLSSDISWNDKYVTIKGANRISKGIRLEHNEDSCNEIMKILEDRVQTIKQDPSKDEWYNKYVKFNARPVESCGREELDETLDKEEYIQDDDEEFIYETERNEKPQDNYSMWNACSYVTPEVCNYVMILEDQESQLVNDFFEALESNDIKKANDILKIDHRMVYLQNGNGMYPLMIAIIKNNSDMVKLLLHWNAPLTCSSKYKNKYITPQDLCRKLRYYEIYEILDTWYKSYDIMLNFKCCYHCGYHKNDCDCKFGYK